jgi:hypothetical protein
MTAAPIHFRDERLMLDPAGAVFWPAKRVLVVADLHFEKSTAAASRGALLPPFDTKATLERLSRLVRLYRPAKVVALGCWRPGPPGQGRPCPYRGDRPRGAVHLDRRQP